jgi:eukaryotic-like serine/threonine-protein kinase
MAEILKKFGRYFLLDRLAQGGMAEICRARLASVDGSVRLIVIKRIQAGYGANSDFLKMFRSEIKVTMGFNHPNIVQLYDFGEEQNQPYIVMELVDGKNLRQMLTRFIEHKQSMPIELTVYVIEQAAAGLHYAHSFKDKITGEALHIVHRDVSPQNILISYEGNIKVIDFGIAKANINTESTRAGVIKGKPSYLSPEQISGDVLDGRSDIFSLGAVLWELLTGKKLFQGENDLAVLKLIESSNTYVKPPSTINKAIPPELDAIVMKSLAKNRDQRYQSAEEFQRALHKFLYNFASDFNPTDLSYAIKDMFKQEIVDDRKKIQRLNDKVEQLLGAQLPEILDLNNNNHDNSNTLLEPKQKSSGAREVFNANGIKESKIELDASLARRTLSKSARVERRSSSATTFTTRTRSTQAKRRRLPNQEMLKRTAAGIAVVLGMSYLSPDMGFKIPFLSDLMRGIFDRGSRESPVSKAPSLIINGQEENGLRVEIDGRNVANMIPVTLKGLPTDTEFTLRIVGKDKKFEKKITIARNEQKSVDVRFVPWDHEIGSIPQNPTTLLKLRITPPGVATSILLNDQRINPANPVASVPLNAPLELSIDAGIGYKPIKRQFVLDKKDIGDKKEWPYEVQLEAVDFSKSGSLTIRTTPSALIKINGKDWGRTPLVGEKLPVGTYQIKLFSEALGVEKTIPIEIRDGKKVEIEDVQWDVKN